MVVFLPEDPFRWDFAIGWLGRPGYFGHIDIDVGPFDLSEKTEDFSSSDPTFFWKFVHLEFLGWA